MLVLTRKPNERIRIGDDIVVTLVDMLSGKVRIGIDAPRDVTVIREDARKRVQSMESSR